MAATIVPHDCRCSPDPRPVARILVTLGPYVPKGRVHGMVLPLRGGRTNCPAHGGLTRQVALPAAYHTSVVAGQQVAGQQVPRRPPIGTPGRSSTMQMWPIAHGDPHHQRCARVRVAISDIWDIACSEPLLSIPRCRRYRRKVVPELAGPVLKSVAPPTSWAWLSLGLGGWPVPAPAWGIRQSPRVAAIAVARSGLRSPCSAPIWAETSASIDGRAWWAI